MEETLITQTSSPPETKQKTNLAPILITLFLSALIFGFGGYFIGKSQISQKSINSNVKYMPLPSNLDVPEVTPSTQNPQTLQWKLYTDTKYGYSIQYPDSKYARIICPQDEIHKFMLVKKYGSNEDPINASTCARDSLFPLELNPEVLEITIPSGGDGYSLEERDVLVDGYAAKKYTQTKLAPQPGPDWIQTIIFSNANKSYVIQYTGDCASDSTIELNKCSAEFDQILSTLKFTP